MIKRSLLKTLKEHLDSDEISLICGPRQAGKTTLMMMLKADLEKAGKRTLFLNLDSEEDLPFFDSQASLVKRLNLEFGNERGYAFIDEIQRKENAGLFLKGIVDQHIPHKLIVSGSGSIELKEKIHESMVGRKRLFELCTLSFHEFVQYRTNYAYEDRLGSFFELEQKKTDGLLEEYLRFGGYPRVVLEERMDEKRRIIEDIYNSYIARDISFLLKVERIESFRLLIKLLASQLGQIINYSELAASAGIASQTLQNYLWYGEGTFIFDRVTPYFKNVRKEITKSPVAYFNDLGLRHYSLGRFGFPLDPVDSGTAFENFVYLLLKEKYAHSGGRIHFWRTTDKAEVDFVVEYGGDIIPIEAKFKAFKKPKVERSMRSFIEKYSPAEAMIINRNLERKEAIGKTVVKFVPYWKLVAA